MSQLNDTPVVIVGAGPSGAMLALLLGRLGVRSLVLSKHRSTANTPRAHIFNQRAMEALRDAGLEDDLAPLASPATDMMHTSWLDALMGTEFGRIYAWGNKPSAKGEYEAASPCVMSDLPQSLLEPVLVQQAAKVGATFHFYHEVLDVQQTDDCVTVTARNRNDGTTYTRQCQYLIGADGARSVVMERIGLPIVGKQLNNAFNVHIRAELGHLFAHRPGSLNWILNVEAKQWSSVGNFRMVKPWSEFVVSMHPSLTAAGAAANDGSPEPSTEEILLRLHQMIGDAHLPPAEQVAITVLSAYRWTINDQYAPTWHKGRVLCIGDAVHRHPPINGLGSNTCISDAFNLAWKLAYVVRGIAKPSILSSLTYERAPVGQAIVKRANAGMRAHRVLWDLLGLTPDERAEAFALLQRSDGKGEAMRWRVRQALEATDDEVQALGMQMNQFYHNIDGALTVQEQQPSSAQQQQLRDDLPPWKAQLDALHADGQLATVSVPDQQATLKHVFVSTAPGFHLPHVWLARNGQSVRCSTLDLCGDGHFTLLTGPGGGDAWRRAADAVTKSTHCPIRVVSIGGPGEEYLDVYFDWTRVRGVQHDGVVVVRPDHFIAWRCTSLSADPTAALDRVFAQLLHTAT